MALQGANRFALFAEDDEQLSPDRPQPHARGSSLIDQDDDNNNANPWHEVKRGGATQKVKTLSIRDESKRPSLYVRSKRTSDSVAGGQTQSRDVSGSTQGGSEPTTDPHENWCGVCQYKFGTKAALLTHIKQSPRHENYCNLCKRVFKDRNGLKNHVDNSQGHDVFCNLCLSAFKDQWGLKNHFENNYAVGHQFVCLTCLLGFRNKTELDRHLQTGAKHVVCNTCHRSFRNQDERDEHWVKTTKHKHCLQPGCDFDAPNAAALQHHLREDHFQCEGCKRIFPSQTQLGRHQEGCTFDVPCPMCGERFAGQAKLAIHRDACFKCPYCDFYTQHEGNYHIHMTKHAAATIPCWSCATPMRTYSSMLNHLESGRCPTFPDPTRLMHCLGKWWYSPLYMDLDIHAQIRRNTVDLEEMVKWMNQSMLNPFICRAEGCGKMFPHCSSLVLHVESQACDWDVERLKLDLFKGEFERMCARRDSVFD